MRKELRKLSLSRETLRILQDGTLQVAGGSHTCTLCNTCQISCVGSCPTVNCTDIDC